MHKIQASGHQAGHADELVADPTEEWTDAPVESDDEDAQLLAVYR